jgi:soluble cytochrome b562
VKSLLKTSEDAVNEENLKWHRERIPQYKKVLSEMVPGSYGDTEVKELKEQVSNLQEQLAEALALLKGGNSKS